MSRPYTSHPRSAPSRPRSRRGFLLLAAGLLSLCTVACGGQQATPECQTIRDCSIGEFCIDGSCKSPSAACKDDTQCPTSLQCVSSSCVPREGPPSCSTDADCKEGLRCTRKLCQQPCFSLPDEKKALLGKPCTREKSSCKGTYICNSAQELACKQDEDAATTETCDGKDNDCDGEVDEDFGDKGKPCTVGLGICQATGKTICNSEGTVLTCDASVTQTPSTEVCDNKDNDCNGAIDDLLSRPCKHSCLFGTALCKAGTWGACSVSSSSLQEKCDGQDNDCDGSVDEELYCVDTFVRLTGRTTGLVFDAQGNLYLADEGNSKILRVDPSGKLTTFAGSGVRGFADGPAEDAKFFGLQGLAIDAAGNLYTADTYNHRIRKIDKAGKVTTFAGDGKCKQNPGASEEGPDCYKDGPARQAQFRNPGPLAFDADGNLFILETRSHRIRKIDKAGMVTTIGTGVAGFKDGPGASAQFGQLSSIASDTTGNMYVTDTANSRIRKIDKAGMVTTFAGDGTRGVKDGPLASAQFFYPTALIADKAGKNLFVFDPNFLRKIDLTTGLVTTLGGERNGGPQSGGYADGPLAQARFSGVGGFAFDASEEYLYFIHVHDDGVGGSIYTLRRIHLQ